jgi:hypothetical protein
MADRAPAAKPADSRIIMLETAALMRLDPDFGLVAHGYSLRVECVWTLGKGHRVWADCTPAASGVCRDETIRDIVQHMNALVGIDVAQNLALEAAGGLSIGIGRPGEAPRVTRTKPTFNGLRRRCFESLCHELLHAKQAWVHGPEPFRELYVQAHNAGRRDGLFGPAPLPGVSHGYIGNRYEQAAERYAHDLVTRHNDALKGGLLDDLLAVDLMQQALAAAD